MDQLRRLKHALGFNPYNIATFNILQSTSKVLSLLHLGKFLKSVTHLISHGKNGFVTATKLGTTNEFFVASTINFAAATKRFIDRTKHFIVVTKYFCYPYFNK